jgi:hypothetical protein
MISQSFKSALALGAMTVLVSACGHGFHSASGGDAAKLNNDALTKAFTPVDATYSVSNTTLASKIEGISLESLGFPARGIIKGQILLKDEDAPVAYYSDAIESSTLKSGVMVDIAAVLPEDNSLGGPLTGTFKCLDNQCAKVGVYFRFYQGAGYIFENSPTGYKLVNSVGGTLALDAALARRGNTVASK